ncbi:SMP-30/gluconolactonase/LRE family protein [Lampropedia aestuarii]|uniref:SMP-30/gluconolactonase/LRE family protein n=1 Tax=Lampropedia aestuarii TaxID=2562762 RepID=UPI0024690873|nr:SMP-30/gluconolactonase/LRE family protein [Lampropedia aestuarii]MDH5858236.1 SMP-30/gluconolactonase/LRE family protein [Lampropedia aestuarii]
MRVEFNRRRLLQAAGLGLASISGVQALAQSFSFTPNQRYPDPAVYVLDPSFEKLRLFNSTLEQLGTGMRWAEGPVYLPSTQKLVLSDIPNNRLMAYDERSGEFQVYKDNANYSNGNTVDQQGRLITCEHLTRRVVRTEEDGSTTVLADAFNGKRLNSPNDVVVRSDGSIWFTDPVFGISGEWEGRSASPEQETTNVYRIGPKGEITAVITDIVNPNGLAFSPQEDKLYVVESHDNPHNSIWRFDVAENGQSVANKTKFIDAGEGAAPDGFRVDQYGNLWCGWGHNASIGTQKEDIGGNMQAYPLNGSPEEFDGVKIFNPEGQAIGFIRLPERCANVAFGGPKRNRLYMASSHSLYALYVNAQGAV